MGVYIGQKWQVTINSDWELTFNDLGQGEARKGEPEKLFSFRRGLLKSLHCLQREKRDLSFNEIGAN